MSLIIKRDGNYIRLYDNITGVPHLERPSKDMYYRDNPVSQRVQFFYGFPNVVIGDIEGYLWSDLTGVNERGVFTFEDYEHLLNWLRVNTGSELAFTNGAADVILNDSTSPIIVAPLSNIIETTSLSAEFTRGSYDITVVDPTNFNIYDFVTIYSVPDDRVMFGHVLSVLGSVVTLSVQSDFNFPIGSVVTLGSSNMNVNGSVTPQIFGVRNPAVTDVPFAFDVSRLTFTILTNSTVSLEKFGDIAGGLLRGVLVRKVDGVWQNLFHWNSNAELKSLCFDLDIQVAGGNQQDGLTARFTFGGQGKLGTVIRLSSGEDLQVVIQDDLTSLVEFSMLAEGSAVSFN